MNGMLEWSLGKIPRFLDCSDPNLNRMGRNTHNTSHKFWDQPPSPHYQCCLQVFGTVFCCKLWRCFSSNILQHWVGWRGLVYFCKVDHSRISIIFFRNWLGLNNLCEILQEFEIGFQEMNYGVLFRSWPKHQYLL